MSKAAQSTLPSFVEIDISQLDPKRGPNGSLSA